MANDWSCRREPITECSSTLIEFRDEQITDRTIPMRTRGARQTPVREDMIHEHTQISFFFSSTPLGLSRALATQRLYLIL